MFKKVLIPVDVSIPMETHRLFSATKALTRSWECDLHVVTVIPSVGMAIVGSYLDQNFDADSRKIVSDQLAQAIIETGLTATQHVLSGTVYDSVINLAAKLRADLIIIGAHQPEFSDYLIGSNAARVVRHSTQSVLVLRDPLASTN